MDFLGQLSFVSILDASSWQDCGELAEWWYPQGFQVSRAERNQTTSFTNSRPYSYHSEYNKFQGSEENIYYIRVFLKTRFVKLGLNKARYIHYKQIPTQSWIRTMSMYMYYRYVTNIFKFNLCCMNDFQLSKGGI